MAEDIDLGNDTRARVERPGAAEATSRFSREAEALGSESRDPGMFGDKLNSGGDPTNNFPSTKNLMAMLDGQAQTEPILDSSAPASESTRLPVTDFKELVPEMKKIFPKLDLDNNGYLSQAELDKAMLNPDFKGKEAQALYVMRQFREGMQNCSNDEWGPENDGVTVADIDALAKIKAIVDAGSSSFNDIDSDKNGFLSSAELETAMSNKDPFLAPAAKLLFSELNDLQAASNDEWGPENDGITKDDLKVYRDKIPSIADLESAVSRSFSKLDGYADTLFSDRWTDPLKSITPSAVCLGEIDDCDFMSDLASMAATDRGKEQIKGMLQDNGINKDGVHTYTVIFPGQKNKPITVVEPTDAQKIAYDKPTIFGIWPSILQKAYAQYKAGKDTDKMPVQEVLKGASKSLEGMQLLTGKTAKQISLESAPKELIEKIILDSLRDGKPISTSRSGYSTEFRSDDSHRYAITGYDAEEHRVVLRNTEGGSPPVGPNRGGVDGNFRLLLRDRDRNPSAILAPPPEFMDAFDTLNYVE